MNDIEQKAAVLIEALPYIQKYEGKVFVIKYGGSAMMNEALKISFAKDATLLRKIGVQVIIVHGGGKEITKIAKAFGLESRFIHGLRYTDEKMMDAVMMGLSSINKRIASYISQNSGNAIGISGCDAKLISAKASNENELGFVGEVSRINTTFLRMLLESSMIPVVAPIGVDEENQFYNINADLAASAIAIALKAEKLVYLSDIPGVTVDNELVKTLTPKDADNFIKKGRISGGMLPKVKSAFNALENNVKKVHFIDGRVRSSLLLEIFTKEGIGTQIIKEEL